MIVVYIENNRRIRFFRHSSWRKLIHFAYCAWRFTVCDACSISSFVLISKKKKRETFAICLSHIWLAIFFLVCIASGLYDKLTTNAITFDWAEWNKVWFWSIFEICSHSSENKCVPCEHHIYQRQTKYYKLFILSPSIKNTNTNFCSSPQVCATCLQCKYSHTAETMPHRKIYETSRVQEKRRKKTVSLGICIRISSNIHLIASWEKRT